MLITIFSSTRVSGVTVTATVPVSLSVIRVIPST